MSYSAKFSRCSNWQGTVRGFSTTQQVKCKGRNNDVMSTGNEASGNPHRHGDQWNVTASRYGYLVIVKDEVTNPLLGKCTVLLTYHAFRKSRDIFLNLTVMIYLTFTRPKPCYQL